VNYPPSLAAPAASRAGARRAPAIAAGVAGLTGLDASDWAFA
jgi:hypothetical protein